jgi:deuterolysin
LIPPVAALYDFESLGSGDYDFEAVNTFMVLDEEPFHTEVSTKKVKIAVKGDVSKRHIPQKRASVSCSSSSQNSFISSR